MADETMGAAFATSLPRTLPDRPISIRNRSCSAAVVSSPRRTPRGSWQQMKKIAALFAVPLLAACAAGTGAPSERAVPSAEPAGPSEGTDPTGTDGGDGLPAGMLDEVLALAEEETGVDRSEIEVVLAEAVTWSDGSIGCPEDGMMYTQALVPGYRVILDVAGEETAFHAPQSGDFFACADPQEPTEGGAQDR
jgi:hypothetical protein